MYFDWKFSSYTFRLLIERYEFHGTVLPINLVFLVMFLSSLCCFFLEKIFYSLIQRERERERERRQAERQRHRQREKQTPCREPDMGLDPGSPGSHLGLQAVLNHWATGAARLCCF